MERLPSTIHSRPRADAKRSETLSPDGPATYVLSKQHACLDLPRCLRHHIVGCVLLLRGHDLSIAELRRFRTQARMG